MVTGHEMTPGLTVVDLDGTLVCCNTFRAYMSAALHTLPLPRRMALAALLMIRKPGLVSHEAIKYRALAIAGEEPALLRRFRSSVRVNDRVCRFLRLRRAAGDRLLLASAAAGATLEPLLDLPGIEVDDVLHSDGLGPDLRGEHKAEAVSRYAAQHGLRINYLLTDHYHDLPSARLTAAAGGHVLLVDPSEKSARRFAAEGFTEFLH